MSEAITEPGVQTEHVVVFNDRARGCLRVQSLIFRDSENRHVFAELVARQDSDMGVQARIRAIGIKLRRGFALPYTPKVVIQFFAFPAQPKRWLEKPSLIPEAITVIHIEFVTIVYAANIMVQSGLQMSPVAVRQELNPSFDGIVPTGFLLLYRCRCPIGTTPSKLGLSSWRGHSNNPERT